MPTTPITDRPIRVGIVGLGQIAELVLKIVNTGRGGWDVLPQSYVWQFERTQDGRGCSCSTTAGTSSRSRSGCSVRSAACSDGSGAPEVAPGYALDAPASLVGEHTTGLRGGLDLTLAVDTYFRSDFYACDERGEVTGSRGSVRGNRISPSAARSRRSRCTATARPVSTTHWPTVVTPGSPHRPRWWPICALRRRCPTSTPPRPRPS